MTKRSLFISTFIVCFMVYTLGIADTYIVDTTGVSGPGSFRQAILDANSHDGDDDIIFQIPDTDPGYVAGQGVWVIRPTSKLPEFIDDSTTVDGSTQADYIGSDTNTMGPEIVIDGINAVDGEGLYITADHTIIKEITIHQFQDVLIQIFSDSNVVLGCYVGPGATGTERMNNNFAGIKISGGSYNTIGGPVSEDRNIISGNQQQGIRITDSSNHNQVLGNYIGINRTGTDTLSNDDGILISKDSRHNVIGPNNVISGNRMDGIYIWADSNSVIGNYIGVNPTGEVDRGNARGGIYLNDANHTQIGGYVPEEGNCISGNDSRGISIFESDSCEIVGNLIGTNASGESAIPNGSSGIFINSCAYNRIGSTAYGGANVISGNAQFGIDMGGPESMYNIIEGNKIGTNIDGSLPLSNGNSGMYLSWGTNNNMIGPENTIAYNLEYGIHLYRPSTIRNTITQNSIHSNEGLGIRLEWDSNEEIEPPEITGIGSVEGTTVPNGSVEIFSAPDEEGMTFEAQVIADGDGNFYWAGTPAGPKVTATVTDEQGNTSEFSAPVQLGNIIVINTDDAGEGSLRWAIDAANVAAGPDTIEFDIPADDDEFNGTVWTIRPVTGYSNLINSGTVIDGFSQRENQGDTNPDGPEIVIDGSLCGSSVSCFTINSALNVIQGLSIVNFSYYGIDIYGETAYGNKIFGNYIGISPDGTEAMPNNEGVEVHNGAYDNTIGGVTIDERNIISGNTGSGMVLDNSHDNAVVGNFIGTDHTGTVAVPNGSYGVSVAYHSYRNIIGREGEGNVISGNDGPGLTIQGEGANENWVYGNLIGVDVSGTSPLGNGQHGIKIWMGARSNIIGQTQTGWGNTIASNENSGISIIEAGTDSNQVAGNYIGTDASGMLNLGNQSSGVYIGLGSRYNQIGPDNLIRFNESNGIYVSGESTLYNRITENSITGNTSKGIYLYGGGNSELEAPHITDVGSVSGTALPNATVEIFSDTYVQGGTHEATVTADGAGNFYWSGTPSGPNITATATDESGNTSEFSRPFILDGFTVTHTGDDGEGSLRWAITNANLMEGSNEIQFDIPTDDDNFDESVWWIRPQTELPALTDTGTVINGFSQQENQGDTNLDGPEIVIDGREATVENADGFKIKAKNSEICGLVICGFSDSGILLSDIDVMVTNCHVWGNYIGTDPTGLDTIPNQYGINLRGNGNIIGGEYSDQRNIIAGNDYYGIHIGNNSNQNQILGNYIGVGRNGYEALGNGHGINISSHCQANQIGGNTAAARNVISSNRHDGVRLSGENCRDNKIQGNYIGVDVTGTTIVGLQNRGILITYEARANQIGGDQPGEGNVISGHDENGILINGALADSNQVIGNYIGTDKDGLENLGNGQRGILVQSGSKYSQITHNLISGNKKGGIQLSWECTDSNTVASNWIGLDATGQDTIPNQGYGIYISNDANYNMIGGPSPESGNVISGNRTSGIFISSDSLSQTTIQNNWIGTDTSGTQSLGNRDCGLDIRGLYNIVQDNVVSGNEIAGIRIHNFSKYHTIANNLIGVQSDGIMPLPNGDDGIQIIDQSSLITIGPGNIIQNHSAAGISLSDSTVKQITITQNSIASNSTGIALFSGANDSIQPPVILSAVPVSGTAPPNCTIEVFADSADQGRWYLGSTPSDGSGIWNFSGAVTGPYITATVTDEDGNTSAFSNSVAVTTQVARENEIPTRFFLSQNYPNPFNPKTKIQFYVKEPCHVQLKVYNLLGKEVKVLIDDHRKAGKYVVVFNANTLPSGLYFYRIQMGNFEAVRKMLLLE